MPPKSKAKKRKTSEANQSTLDSFRIAQPGRSLTPIHFISHTAPTSTVNSANDRIQQQPTTSDDSSTSVKYNNNLHAGSFLGSFRQHALIDKIPILLCKETPSTPALSNEQINDTFAKLDNLLRSILHQTPNDLGFQVAYELCRSVCLFGKPKELYKDLESTLDEHMQQEKHVIMGETDQDTFLETLDNHWTTLCQQLVTIRNIFMELDRRYIMSETSHPSILHLGKSMFRKIVMGVPRIQSKAISGVLKLIQQDRDGLDVNLERLRSMTQMMLDLSLYDDVFEPSFLSSTIQYYSAESTETMDRLSITDYLQHVKDRVQQESEYRIATYLDKGTKISLTEAVTNQLLYTKIDIIISQGFDDMMDHCERESLGILYHFVSSHESIVKLRTAFGDYIKKRGVTMVKDPAKDQVMVTTLLSFKDELDKTLHDSFDNNPTFANAFKESFETFINSRRNKPAEMLAKYFDTMLRSGAKQPPEHRIESHLDKVLVIFRYLQGKDTFEAFYKRFLSKRLLLNRTTSNDLEKSILGKIKSECGPDFTKNLEGMFKDMDISADVNNTFKESKEYGEQDSIPLYVNVLAQGVWPTYPTTDIMLPTNMASLLQAYQTFYIKSFKGRKLAWRNALGSCVVKSHFPKGSKELTVSLFQTIVLLLFNDTTKLTMDYKDIALATNLDDKELKRVLQSLSCGKHKLLVKQPPNDTITDGDTFAYNSNFSASAVRLKINSIQQEQSTEERKETQTKVLVDRQYQLEAAVVRIMKSKKQMTHVALVNELFVQLKFPIDATDIKKRIESLIDREYLCRDETDNSVYLYQS